MIVEYPKKLASLVRERMGPLEKLRDRRYGRTYLAIYGPPLAEAGATELCSCICVNCATLEAEKRGPGMQAGQAAYARRPAPPAPARWPPCMRPADHPLLP